MGKKLSSLILISTTLLFWSCTINYNDQDSNITKSEAIPDSAMINFKLIKIKNNTPNTEVFSSSAEVFNSQNKTVLKNVVFTEYDTVSKEINTQGKADTVEYFNDTEEAKLNGNLNFVSKKDEIEMTGEYLHWQKKDRRILSSPETFIEVVKEDGSSIKGFGFSANLRDSTFKFQKNITGQTK